MCSGIKERARSSGSELCEPARRAGARPNWRASERDKGRRVGYSTVTPRAFRVGPGTSVLVRHQRGSDAQLHSGTKASLKRKKMSTQVSGISPGEAYAIGWKVR